MQIDLGVKKISVFSASIPLNTKLETDFHSWLPSNLQKASQVRKQEYLAGRYCANQAALSLGLDLAELPTASTREPIWPRGMKGSISHSKKMAISCVSRSEDYFSVGIDAEELINSKVEIESIVACEKELILINTNYNLGLTVLFSGKEALYKALFPIVKCYIDFKEVQLVKIDFINEEFTFELQSPRPELQKVNGTYEGIFKLHDETVITMVSISNEQVGKIC